MRKVFALFGTIALDGMNTVNRQLTGLDKSLKTASRQLAKTGRDIEKLGTSFTKTFTVPIALAGGAVLKFGSDFEKSMKTSTAIMGNLSDEMKKKMGDVAKEVSTKTTQSASDLAKAYYYLASAGFNAEQSISALPRVAKFAEAGQFDLQRATDLLTDAQSALGLTVKDVAKNEENMVRVSDVLVRANTLANASVEQFSEALTTRAGAALRILGKDVEEGAAVLAAYADQGVKAADAGTQFGIVLRDLQKAALKNSDVFKKYNVAVYDGSGEMRNMADILADLERALEGKSDAEKKSILTMMEFQERSVASLLTLIGTSDKIREYEAALREAGGTTEDVANKQLDNFQDQLKIIRNRLVNAAIALSNDLLPILKDKFVPAAEEAITKIQGMVKWFKELDPIVKNNIMRFLGFLAVMGPLLIVLGKTMKAVAGLRATILLLNSAILTNPYVQVIAMLGILGGLLLKIKGNYDDLNESRAENNRLLEEEIKLTKEMTNAKTIEALEEIEFLYKTLAAGAVQDDSILGKNTLKRIRELEQSINMGFSGDYQARLDKVIKKIKELKGELASPPPKPGGGGDGLSEKELKAAERAKERKEKLDRDYLLGVREGQREAREYVEKQDEEAQKRQEQRNRERREREAEDDAEGERRRQEYFDREKERKEYIKQFSIGAVFSVFDTFRMAQENKLAAIDLEAEKERERIENSMLSEDEKQKKLEELDEKTAKKKRALARKQAVLEKLTGIFSIGISTAQAIMKAWAHLGPIMGPIMAGIVGTIGAIQAAIVAAKPIPQAAKGLFVKGGRGGALTEVGEAEQDEIILPLKTGVQQLADALLSRISRMATSIPQLLPAPSPAYAGAPGGAYGAGAAGARPVQWHLHIGTLIADERGLKELERRMSQYRYMEADRRGAR